VIVTHGQMLFLEVTTNAISFGMTSAAARQRMSCSLEDMSALVGTLAFSIAAAVLTKAAAMFLRMLSLVMVSNGIVHRMLSPAVNPPHDTNSYQRKG
jgi:hypothetical protein